MNTQTKPRVMPGVTWTNNKVAIAKDLIFGVCVLSDQGWKPFDMLDQADRTKVLHLIDWNASCMYLQDLQELHTKLITEGK